MDHRFVQGWGLLTRILVQRFCRNQTTKERTNIVSSLICEYVHALEFHANREGPTASHRAMHRAAPNTRTTRIDFVRAHRGSPARSEKCLQQNPSGYRVTFSFMCLVCYTRKLSKGTSVEFADVCMCVLGGFFHDKFAEPCTQTHFILHVCVSGCCLKHI